MAARDLVIGGVTYPAVQKIHAIDSNGLVHTYVEVSDTTAGENDILNGAVFYDQYGVAHTGKGTMIRKVTTQDSGGGDIVNFIGDWLSDYNYIGLNAEILNTYNLGTVYLKDTSFNGWTPSTTAKTIVASSNLQTYAADMTEYEYWLLWFVDTHTAYASGTTLQGAPVHQTVGLLQSICRRASNLTNVQAETENYNVCNSLFSASSAMDYYNTSGTHTWGWTGSYGIYAEVTAATFSSSTSYTPTITIKSPVYRARCSTSYFTTTMAGAVDQDNSYISGKGYFFRAKASSGTYYNMYHNIMNVFNHGV